MKEPTLVILAAGMGSRFGGLKQITPIDDSGHSIIDFSLYDAYRAGFKNVAFIIKHEIEDDFKKHIGLRMEKYFNVKYIFQQLDMLPDGCCVPDGRIKPWGTGHAVMCCRGIVDGPFAVINSDDFYGPSAYTKLYDFLISDHPENEHTMIAYKLKNTVTDSGTVARGICAAADGYLTDIVERTKIEKRGEDAAFTEDDGLSWNLLDGETPVSMNCWGFSSNLLDELYSRFYPWFEKNIKQNPLKCEYFLPGVVNELIHENKAQVRLADCAETWYGMTYKEDMLTVSSAVGNMKKDGIYPSGLLD